MSDNRLNYLFRQYFDKKATPAERDELFLMLSQSRSDEEVSELMEEVYQAYQPQGNPFGLGRREAMLKAILETQASEYDLKKRNKTGWFKYVAAASILIFLSVGLYFYQHKSINSPRIAQHSPNDIAPGGNKAILTLASGKRIILSNAKNGKLVQEGATIINKTKDGEVVYYTNSKVSPPAGGGDLEGANTISTPNGGKYRLTLPDGTQVWLNAGSSLRFPTTFSGNERNVELNGEAYFEVAKNKAMPFHVKTSKEVVEVLGTHFEVMAYVDEKNTETTLLEGSVRVSQSDQRVILKPGQQSIIQSFNNSIIVKDADTEEITAWKNDLFQFNNTPMAQVARQIERWYNVKVNYQGVNAGTTFTGILSRNNNLSKLIGLLESTGNIKFTVQGQDIIVKSTR